MAVAYTKRLLGGVVAANATVVYTAPAGSTIVLRSIQLTNRAVTATPTLLELTGGIAMFTHNGIPASSTISLDVRVALNPGETLTAYAFTNALHVVVTGYQFTNP